MRSMAAGLFLILGTLVGVASPVFSQEIPPPPETVVTDETTSPAPVAPTGPQKAPEAGTPAAAPAAVPEAVLSPTPAVVATSTAAIPSSPAATEPARWWVGVGSGYSGVSLGEAERNLELILRSELDIFFYDVLGPLGSYVDGMPLAEIQEVTGGLYVSSEIGVRLNRTLGVGVRGSRGFYPDLVAHLEARGTGGEYLDETYTFSVDASKIMVGVLAGTGPAGSPFTFHLGAFAGPLFFTSDMDYSLEYWVPLYMTEPDHEAWTVPYQGTALAMDFGADAGYTFLRGCEVYAEAGYSLARVDRVQVREDVDIDRDGTADYVQGETLEDASGSPIRADLSGLRAGGGFRFRF